MPPTRRPGAAPMLMLIPWVVVAAASCAGPRGPGPGGAGAAGPSRPTPALLADSVRRMIDAAVLVESRPQLAEARGVAERALTVFADDPLLLHYRGYALFREAGLAWDHDEAEVPPLLRESERALEGSMRGRPLAETAALLARIQGYLSALYPRLGADLGAKARGYRADAERLGAGNPRVWLLRAQGAFYTPEVHGGGLARAEEQLRRALALYTTDRPAPPLPSWGEAEAHAWLGQAYAATNRPAEARAAYEAALRIAPGYAWVRDSLLPRVKP